MKVKKEDIFHVATLARLELEKDEAELLTGDMNDILDYIERLAELNTDNVEPTSHAMEVNNVFREDLLKRDFTIEEAMANAPDSENNSFKVPKVIE